MGARSYLLESQTEHLGYAATKAAIKAMQAHGRRASVILIEDRANGSAVIEELRQDDLGASVVAIEPEGGKQSRAYAASADAEAGNVFLPEDAPWLASFLRTAAAFPAVKHDDEIDALTQFLNWRRSRSQGVLGVLEYGRRIAQEVAQGIRDRWGELIHPKPKPAAPARPQPVTASSRPAQERFVCPACKSVACVRLGAPNTIHCNQCRADFTPGGELLSKPEQEEPNHIHRWRPIPGNQERCDDCEEQRWIGSVPALNGMSRRQYEAQRGLGRFRN